MKKILFCLLLIGICSFAQADNSAKIAELTAKQQEIIKQLQQAQQFIQNAQAEALRLDGAIGILKELDAPKIEEKK